MTLGRNVRETVRDLDRNTAMTMSAVDALTRWVFPLALGTTPASLATIRSIVGIESRMDLSGDPVPVDRPSNDEPTMNDLRLASTLVSRIILRLWTMDGLSAGRGDDELVARSEQFRQEPYGIAAHMPKPPKTEVPT